MTTMQMPPSIVTTQAPRGDEADHTIPSPPQAPKSAWRWVRACVTAALFAIAVLIAWPANHGGPFCLAIVSGTSMQPTYHTGDLVVAMKSNHYSIGEVIVYEVQDGDIHGRVVHRIVEQLPDGNFRTKGDNKPFPDPWEVQPGWIYGHAVTMLPQGYAVIGLLRSPWILALICGALVMFALWPRRKEEPESANTESEETEPDESDDGLATGDQ